jgi:hypothetical protein
LDTGVQLAQARLRDRGPFDNTMSKGPSALIGWLGLASAILIVMIASLTVALTPATPVTMGTGRGCCGAP